MRARFGILQAALSFDALHRISDIILTAKANEVGVAIVFEPNDCGRGYRKRDEKGGEKEYVRKPHRS